MMTLFANLLLAHMLADFWFQGKRMVANKREHKLCGRGIYVHVLIVFALAWLVVGDVAFIKFAALIAVTHFIIDYIKVKFSKCGFISFIIDQILHVLVLVGVSVLYMGLGNPWTQYLFIPSDLALVTPVVGIGFIAITNPTNIFIKEIFNYYKIFEKEMSSSLILIDKGNGVEGHFRNAGAIVGILERILVLVFILNKNYQAVGFVFAAKSILRFKLDNAEKSEYVLVGTMLSLVIVVMISILFKTVYFFCKA